MIYPSLSLNSNEQVTETSSPITLTDAQSSTRLIPEPNDDVCSNFDYDHHGFALALQIYSCGHQYTHCRCDIDSTGAYCGTYSESVCGQQRTVLGSSRVDRGDSTIGDYDVSGAIESNDTGWRNQALGRLLKYSLTSNDHSLVPL